MSAENPTSNGKSASGEKNPVAQEKPQIEPQEQAREAPLVEKPSEDIAARDAEKLDEVRERLGLEKSTTEQNPEKLSPEYDALKKGMLDGSISLEKMRDKLLEFDQSTPGREASEQNLAFLRDPEVENFIAQHPEANERYHAFLSFTEFHVAQRHAKNEPEKAIAHLRNALESAKVDTTEQGWMAYVWGTLLYMEGKEIPGEIIAKSAETGNDGILKNFNAGLKERGVPSYEEDYARPRADSEQAFDPEAWKNTSWDNEEGEKVTIDEILEYLEQQPATELNVQELLAQLPPLPKREPERVKNANLEHPIIVIKREGQIRWVLDGNHRLQRATDENRENIKAKILDLDDPTTLQKYVRVLSGIK